MSRICVRMRTFARVTAPLFVVLCSVPLIAKAEAPRIGLYYLDDVDYPGGPASTLNGRKGVLQGDLVFSDTDIVDYCWRSHSLQLTTEAAERLPKSGWPTSSKSIPESKLVSVHGKPFVLVVDGARCYSGAFWTHLSSIATSGPVIMVDTLGEFPGTAVNPAPRGSFQIELGYPNPTAQLPPHAEDVRDCPSLKKALLEMGKLRKGC